MQLSRLQKLESQTARAGANVTASALTSHSAVSSVPMTSSDLGHILLVDDNQEMLNMLEEFLVQSNYRVSKFDSATKALEFLARLSSEPQSFSQGTPDLVISDVRMPQMTGIDLTKQIKNQFPHIPVILTTAFGSIDGAVEAMKIGVYDYITKPFRLASVLVAVNRAVETNKLRNANEVLRGASQSQWSFCGMIGKSPTMRLVFDLISRVAPTKATVLILGESGTGKEMIAKSLHQLSPRQAKPFVAINCAAIPENLLESELFGHAKGAFTGAHSAKKGLIAEAEGGTLFLDEIGDLNLTLQAKLLRVLQDHKIRPVGENTLVDIDVRIVCATHKDLKTCVAQGTFREDLYYRLSVIPIKVPALCERKEDILLLAEHFLKKHVAQNGSLVRGFKQNVAPLLTNYSWPGNVRELENLIERVVILNSEPLIDCKDIDLNVCPDSFTKSFDSSLENLISLEELEKKYIDFVLAKVGGKKEHAAKILGINRRTLYRKG